MDDPVLTPYLKVLLLLRFLVGMFLLITMPIVYFFVFLPIVFRAPFGAISIVLVIFPPLVTWLGYHMALRHALPRLRYMMRSDR